MIRHAKKEDISFLLNIYNEEVLNGTATFDLEIKTLEDRLNWFYSHKGKHPLLVYVKDEKVVGYSSLSEYKNKKAYDGTAELSIYIHKDYRGLGIGKQLMEAIIDYSKKNKEIHTIISVITGGNEASVKLHEKFGFVYCGRIKEAGYKFNNYIDIDIYQIII